MRRVTMITKQVECPECGTYIERVEFYDRLSKVEEKEKCFNCGYEYHWSHGSVITNTKGEMK